MRNQKYDLIWKKGSFFRRGHWELIPKESGSSVVVGYIIVLLVIIFLLSLVVLSLPIWFFFLGLSMRREKRYYAGIAVALGALYFFLDRENQWLTSFLFYGYSNGEEFTEKCLKETGVAMIPGTAFGTCAIHNVRFNFATSRENISKAVEKIDKILK